jgi:hypothetical protein
MPAIHASEQRRIKLGFHPVLNRAVRGAMCILFAAMLTGFSWGNSETDQRKAFIAFLQDINNRSGIHFLVRMQMTRKRSDLICSITRLSWTSTKT